MAADDALELAIQRVADAYQMSGTGAGFMLGEFLVMAEWPSIAEDNSTYHWFVSGRNMPRHHMQGLYAILGSMIRLEFEQPGGD
jgi:hypothetical protein